jgi:hypothetical protein
VYEQRQVRDQCAQLYSQVRQAQKEKENTKKTKNRDQFAQLYSQ